MELKVINDKGEAQKSVDASENLFGRDYNEALVHQIVVAFQANARLGTRAQLDRAMVKHSTKKPWRQKGTGRARAGMTSSPRMASLRAGSTAGQTTSPASGSPPCSLQMPRGILSTGRLMS